MAQPKSLLSTKSTYGWPVLLVAASLGVYFLPDLRATLIYDRSAIIAGELWRLITGHLVHFTLSHLFYNVTVLCITGWIIESRNYRYFVALCLLSALSVGIVILVFLPEMAYYGGLSGIAMACAVYLALQSLREPTPWRSAGLLILLLCVSKLIFEAFIDHFVLVVCDNGIRPAPLSHLVGATSGVIVYFWSVIN